MLSTNIYIETDLYHYVQRCRERVTFVTFVRARITLVRIELPPPSCNRYKMILYRQLSQRWHPWISVTQFDANMSRGAFIRTIRWVTFVHRNCTESHSFRYLLSKRARPYKKDDNDEEAVLVRDSIYFIYFLHESLCFFFFLINKSLSGCLEGHSFCWLNR